MGPFCLMFVQVCVTERDRAHTCEATEAVTQHLSPSQPQELVLRTDREMGEGRGDRGLRSWGWTWWGPGLQLEGLGF